MSWERRTKTFWEKVVWAWHKRITKTWYEKEGLVSAAAHLYLLGPVDKNDIYPTILQVKYLSAKYRWALPKDGYKQPEATK